MRKLYHIDAFLVGRVDLARLAEATNWNRGPDSLGWTDIHMIDGSPSTRQQTAWNPCTVLRDELYLRNANSGQHPRPYIFGSLREF